MTKLRVLIVSHTYAAPINRAKLDALARHVSLTAIIPSHWSDALFDLHSEAPASPGYVVHRLPIHFSGHILRYCFPIRHLARIVLQAEPDVVYVEEEPVSVVLAQLAYLKSRLRYRLIFFTWENIYRRIGLRLLEHFNLHRCDGAIAGSAEAAEVIRSKGFRGAVRVTPQLGIDPKVFQPARSDDFRRSLSLTGFVVGYIGRLTKEKGVRVLVEAVRGLPGTHLLIVGGGPLRSEIESIACDSSLPDRVRLVDAVPHEQIVPYLNALDVLVLPSQTTPTWKEQFGHVLIEAMACGVPVIGSSSGAISEVVGDAGLIFPEGDITALRTAIDGLRTSPDWRAALARAGRERVLGRYTHDRIAADNAEFFTQVLRA